MSLSILINSCSKETNPSETANVFQQNEDNNNFKSEADNLNNDINNVLNEVGGFKKTGSIEKLDICGATIDSSGASGNIPKLIINFDGTTTCGLLARIRSGSITVELIQGKKWSEKDAKLKVTMNNYKVSFPTKGNKSITVNGVKTLENIDGYNWIEIFTKGTLKFKYRERAYNLDIKYEDGKTAVWNSARLVTWTYTASNKEIAVIVDGDSTQGTKKIDSWGTSRFAESFTNYVSQAWESNSTCGLWKPIKGKYESKTSSMEFNVTLGVDQTGKQVSSGCAYGVSIDWNLLKLNKTGTSIEAYW